MVKPLLLLPPVAFVALAGLFLWGMNRQDPGAMPTAFKGKPAPVVTLQPLGEAAPFTDATLRDGTVKLVNFWASWCAPCREELPELMSLKTEGVPVYGVDWKDQPAKALAFLAEYGSPFAALGADPQNKMGLDWGVAGVPETFVIDGDGKVLMRHAGPLTDQFIEDSIEPLLSGDGTPSDKGSAEN